MLFFKWFEGTQSLMFRDALFIREQVFVIEQNVDVALEIDGEDDQRWHIVAYADQQPVATARVYFPNGDGQLKIQRVAVKQSLRGQHIGLQLMQAIEKWALSQASTVLILSASSCLSFSSSLLFSWLIKSISAISSAFLTFSLL